MTDRPEGLPERRRYPRSDIAYPLEVEVTVGASGSELANGVTINLARGGVLTRLDHDMGVGERCVVHFAPADKQVIPDTVSGTVRRVEKEGEDFLAAIEFDDPLAEIPL